MTKVLPVCFFTRRSSNSRTLPRPCVLTTGCRAEVPDRKTTRKGPGRRWPRRAQPYGPVSRFPEGCACALCWSPWQGLWAKTRLSRLVLNFLPSAPADSPLALRGSLRRQGWGSRRSGRAVCAHWPDAPSRPPFFLPPPPPPVTSWPSRPGSNRRPRPRPPRPGCVLSQSLAGLSGGDPRPGEGRLQQGRLGALRRVLSPRAPVVEGPLPSFLSLKFRKASSAPLPCFQTVFAFESWTHSKACVGLNGPDYYFIFPSGE